MIAPDMAQLLKQLEGWPVARRIELAERILQNARASSDQRPRARRRLDELAGLLATKAPPPDDSQCDDMLTAELCRKHLK
jgi:hypothetical protein